LPPVATAGGFFTPGRIVCKRKGNIMAKNILTEIESVIEAPLKGASKTLITEGITAAWSAATTVTGTTAVTDFNVLANAFGTKLGPIGSELVKLAEVPVDALIVEAGAKLGNPTTEQEVITYVLEHAGLE
jgi:hypothetical protein